MIFFMRFALFTIFLLWAQFAAAQDQTRGADDPVYPFWNEVAGSAEESIDASEQATNDDLDVLRDRLVAFRNEFSNQRGANAERIESLKSQITALGPVPEVGSESEEIARQREALTTELESFEAPVRVADAAFRRADGLISEIDQILRERQKRRLLSLGPSPVDPRNWPAAFEDLGRMLSDLRDNVNTLTRQRLESELGDRLPLIFLLIVVSSALIVRGRRWAGNAVEYMRRFGGSGSGVWSFLVSLLRIFIPLTGLYVLSYALRMTNILSPFVEEFLSLLPVWGLVLLGFHWLSERLFGRRDDEPLIYLPTEKRRTARFYMQMLSILFVLRGLLDIIFNVESSKPETIALIAFPVVVVMGLVMISSLACCYGARLKIRTMMTWKTRIRRLDWRVWSVLSETSWSVWVLRLLLWPPSVTRKPVTRYFTPQQ